MPAARDAGLPRHRRTEWTHTCRDSAHGAASGSAIYALATWDRPNRATLLIVAAIAMASIPVVLGLPLERIVRGRWREPFFVFWTGFLLVCIAAATHPERISARLGL